MICFPRINRVSYLGQIIYGQAGGIWQSKKGIVSIFDAQKGDRHNENKI